MDKTTLEYKYIKERKSTWKIAEEAGVKQVTVWRWLKKYDIPRRRYTENTTPVPKGSKMPDTHRNAISEAHLKRAAKWVVWDDEHHNWKGDDVGYKALHDWVKRRLGTPTKCEHCKYQTEAPLKIQWANLSGDYKRELGDWMPLCVKCHRAYDTWKTRYNQYA